ncbi:MAG TPA: SAM-dependent methyltransferase [Flavobacteriales bacterium]|nr:SAM-dependent methyltransferase [Flavobacteriales bacterium]
MFKIITTKDGSDTLYNPELDEHYHSINGAIQESKHVFINAGFKEIRKNELSVLEVGFGTGLNALLTLKECGLLENKIQYTAVELFPLTHEVIQKLNYDDIIGEADSFHKMHSCAWNTWVDINDQFLLKKLKVDLRTMHFQDKYDLVYFDAFSPQKQPALWTGEIFDKIVSACNEDAVFTTYSAKGSVRRGLQKAGFYVERIPGPPGKREMIRARRVL